MSWLNHLTLLPPHSSPASLFSRLTLLPQAFPVTHELWLQYCRYLEVHLKIPAVISKVYSRALRNCYWVGSLWARAIR
jgi:hypothetical protein